MKTGLIGTAVLAASIALAGCATSPGYGSGYGNSGYGNSGYGSGYGNNNRPANCYDCGTVTRIAADNTDFVRPGEVLSCVGCHDARPAAPLRQVSQGFVLAGVSAEGFDVYAGYADQLGATALVELIEVRLVLEEVGIQALFRDLNVRLHVVGEDLDLQVHAFFGQGRFHELEDFRVRHRGGGNGQGFCSLGGERSNGCERDE